MPHDHHDHDHFHHDGMSSSGHPYRDDNDTPLTYWQTMEIANIIGAFDEVANPGVIEFEREGVTYQLEAIDEGGDELFLVFADRTNGHGSYGAGRFVYVPKPDAEGRLWVDF